jgi:hypothetical protein
MDRDRLKWKIKECELCQDSLSERSERVFGLWINCAEWSENPTLMERQKASQIKKDHVSGSPSKYARGNRAVFHALLRGKPFNFTLSARHTTYGRAEEKGSPISQP